VERKGLRRKIARERGKVKAMKEGAASGFFATAWHMQIGAAPCAVSRNPQMRTPSRLRLGVEWWRWTLPKKKTGIYNQCGLGRNPSRLRGNPGPYAGISPTGKKSP
jgi:hypothetical protein